MSLKNDGQCWIWVPTDISLSTLEEQSGVDRVNAIHATINKPLVTLGGINPYKMLLTDIADTAADGTRDAGIWNGTSMSVWGPIENIDFLTRNNKLDKILLIVLCGGDVEGLPVWFEITDIKEECPFSDTEPKETWETWGTYEESHKPIKLGDKWYRSNAVGISGDMLPASAWIKKGLTVKTRKEYMKIVQDNSPI